MNKRSFVLLGVLVLVAAVAASSYVIVTRQEELPPTALGPVDFIGEVVSAEFDPSWVLNPPTVAFAHGGPDLDITVGPQTIVLANGTSLYVPAGTPGGNWCTELIPPPSRKFEDEFHSTQCVVMGQLTARGDVAWFTVLETEDYQGRVLVDVGYATTIAPSGEVSWAGTSIEFPFATLEADCGLLVSEVAAVRALVDWSTGEVVALICLFDY